jgi:hypothetical protein
MRRRFSQRQSHADWFTAPTLSTEFARSDFHILTDEYLQLCILSLWILIYYEAQKFSTF